MNLHSICPKFYHGDMVLDLCHINRLLLVNQVDINAWDIESCLLLQKNIHPTLLLFASDYANDKSFCLVQSILHEYVKKVTQPWQTITILSFFNPPFWPVALITQRKYKSAYFESLHLCPPSIFRWKFDFNTFRASQTAEWQAREYFQLPSWFLHLQLAQQ